MERKKRSEILAVLVAAYLCAFLIESFSFSVEWHFWLYSALSLMMAYYCYHSRTAPVLVYGLLNILHLFLYVPLIHDDYSFIHSALWYGYFPMSDVMLSYEIVLLIYWGCDGLAAIYRDYNDGSRRSHSLFDH